MKIGLSRSEESPIFLLVTRPTTVSFFLPLSHSFRSKLNLSSYVDPATRREPFVTLDTGFRGNSLPLTHISTRWENSHPEDEQIILYNITMVIYPRKYTKLSTLIYPEICGPYGNQTHTILVLPTSCSYPMNHWYLNYTATLKLTALCYI